MAAAPAGKSKTLPQTAAMQTPRLMGNAHPMMVGDHYVSLLREIRLERQARLEAVKTPRAAIAYQERAQEAIDKAFAPIPRRTPLNGRVTGVNETKICRIENILFESRPGCLVTGNLYIPHGCNARNPLPGVIADCGHSNNGKQAIPYQNFPQRLAANGFVTLLIDPFNQGERNQYYGVKNAEKLSCDQCCDAHNMMGKQLEIIGEFFGMWRAWDNIRALDYLLTRPEVDPAHLGMTGNSGGGTMTTWTWAIEKRLTMAAPSCFVTSFAANLENELPADCEQYPPGVIGAGLDMADFLIVRAPQPSILLAQKLDFFDRRGAQEAHREVSRFYDVLGAGDKHELFIGPSRHGYSYHNQEAMVAFFHKQVGKRGPVKKLSDKQTIDMKAKLLVTPKGNVVAAGSIPIFKLIAEKAAAIDAERRRKAAPKPAALAATVRRLLNIDEEVGTVAGIRNAPHFRVLRPNTFANFRAARYAIETEASGREDLYASIRAVLFKPLPTLGVSLDVEQNITLYLPHVSSEAELNDKKLAGKLIDKCALYALDVRGTGESLPVRPPESDFFAPYQFDYMYHGHGLMLGESFLGRRVFDVLRTLDLLASEGVKSVQLIGRGQGALLAAFVGLLSPSLVKHVTLLNSPVSFLEWASVPIVHWPAANIPKDVLRHFDIPDLHRALRGRITIGKSWDAQMKPRSR
jgi:dienelactone hydrolase